ncbi:DUF423 domain-containing protein [Piscirickettsia salmonis]|uniref:DUF423 domain-containing protein n=1 Tax=Piscirickettsia salmonis TaxID=1238 RepID=UPI0007C8C70E|nr:hypothetical protein A0O36_02480 [Piscirickettsiaceae bacterium NZ-RLO1]
MMAVAQKVIGWGALSMLVSVILGAVGTHVLTDVLTVQALHAYQIAVNYQLYHSLGLILIGILLLHYQPCKRLVGVVFLLVAGIVLFSGSLYVFVIFHGAWLWLRLLTPIGGMCWIIAWGLLAWTFMRYRPHHK